MRGTKSKREAVLAGEHVPEAQARVENELERAAQVAIVEVRPEAAASDLELLSKTFAKMR